MTDEQLLKNHLDAIIRVLGRGRTIHYLIKALEEEMSKAMRSRQPVRSEQILILYRNLTNY